MKRSKKQLNRSWSNSMHSIYGQILLLRSSVLSKNFELPRPIIKTTIPITPKGLTAKQWFHPNYKNSEKNGSISSNTHRHLYPLSKQDSMSFITYEEFDHIDLRVGTIIDAKDFPEAKKPAYKLTIDFWSDIGIRHSSAQITKHYTKEGLIGKQVIAVINFPPKQIWPFMSECLTTGLPDEGWGVVLIHPSQPVPNGGKLF